MEYDFDVVVLGSGAGGAAFAHRCARAGRRVLVIERGANPLQEFAPSDTDLRDERATLIDKRWYDDRTVTVNNANLRLFMGGVVGGGTALFGGAMIRPSIDDFQPGKHYGDRLPRELWEWPVSYEALASYYDDAEKLYRVAGSADAGCAPLQACGRRNPHELLPLAPINVRLIAANQAEGLRPFRLPLAIDSGICERCDACAGFLCTKGARRSAAQVLDESARSHSLQLMANTEIENLQVGNRGRIDAVTVRDRSNGSVRSVRARAFASAAGAIGSPAILLRSGIDGPHIGRNYMMHYSPIAVGIFAQPTGASETFVKQVGFADFYYGTPALPRKMGLVQSLPAPGPLMMAKLGMKRWPRQVLSFLRSRMLLLAGIVEDLPNPTNRVEVGANGAIRLRHDFSDFDRVRGKELAREMRQILRRTGAIFQSARAFPSREHVAHQCGTLRFGRDARHAPVDADGRIFGHENLFVVDGSILPTSTGVGPSLTITALALRTADAALAGI